MNQYRLNIIEGFGLVIILLSTFIQILETSALSTKNEFDYAKIHRKLDNLWKVNSHQYSENHPKDSIYFAINFKHLVEDWKIYSQEYEESLYLNSRINSTQNVRIIFFVLGSILLMVPKFIKPNPSFDKPKLRNVVAFRSRMSYKPDFRSRNKALKH